MVQCTGSVIFSASVVKKVGQSWREPERLRMCATLRRRRDAKASKPAGKQDGCAFRAGPGWRIRRIALAAECSLDKIVLYRWCLYVRAAQASTKACICFAFYRMGAAGDWLHFLDFL